MSSHSVFEPREIAPFPAFSRINITPEARKKLTLKNSDERLGEFVGEKRLWQFSEILFHQIRDVVGLLPVEVDVVPLRFRHDLELLYPRFHPAFPENAHLVEGVGAQPAKRDLDALWQSLARPLQGQEQGHAEDGFVLVIRALYLPYELWEFPVPAGFVSGAVTLHAGGQFEEGEFTEDEQLPAGHRGHCPGAEGVQGLGVQGTALKTVPPDDAVFRLGRVLLLVRVAARCGRAAFLALWKTGFLTQCEPWLL